MLCIRYIAITILTSCLCTAIDVAEGRGRQQKLIRREADGAGSSLVESTEEFFSMPSIGSLLTGGSDPTKDPTAEPSAGPTKDPTAAPSAVPSGGPTKDRNTRIKHRIKNHSK